MAAKRRPWRKPEIAAEFDVLAEESLMRAYRVWTHLSSQYCPAKPLHEQFAIFQTDMDRLQKEINP